VKKNLEDSVPAVQKIEVHKKVKQLILLWEVVIGWEQRYTKHIITLCGQKDMCFLILKQVLHFLTVVLEGIFENFQGERTDIGVEVSNVISKFIDIRFDKYPRLLF
jgi:hypothetical protein